MSYFVSKTDGSVIVVLDGTKDTTSTSLTLFGRLVQNYGDQTNENFVRLLENFSLATGPANPITGQLWFDTTTNNIKAYTTDNAWVTVGSVIQGNVDISGNLKIGPYAFAVKDLDGNVQITNSVNSGNVSFYTNVAGASTRVLHLNSRTGLIEVNANASTNLGVTTKIYVDSEIQRATSGGNTNLVANVAIINANLVARINAESGLRANITAANAQIALRDTITRVNSINSAIDTAITANVNAIYSNLAARVNQTVAVNTAMIANVAAANAKIDAANVTVTALSNRLNSVNTAREIALAANLALKAPLASPTFTGTPETPTGTINTTGAMISSKQFVMDTLGVNVLPRFTSIFAAMSANVAAANIKINAANVDIEDLEDKISSVNTARNTALTANLALKAPLASPTFTGTPETPTGTINTTGAMISSKQFVMDTLGVNVLPRFTSIFAALVANVAAANARVNAANVNIEDLEDKISLVNTARNTALTANLALKAPLDNPVFTGTPETPTGTINTTGAMISSKQFVMDTLGANILPRFTSVYTALVANVAAANARVNAANVNIEDLEDKISSVNTARNTALTANLALKAPLASPTFTGTPRTTEPDFSDDSDRIATTAFVQDHNLRWAGSRKFVSTADPTVSDGSNGDIWFKYTS
jgi:hypothetical protein